VNEPLFKKEVQKYGKSLKGKGKNLNIQDGWGFKE